MGVRKVAKPMQIEDFVKYVPGRSRVTSDAIQVRIHIKLEPTKRIESNRGKADAIRSEFAPMQTASRITMPERDATSEMVGASYHGLGQSDPEGGDHVKSDAVPLITQKKQPASK